MWKEFFFRFHFFMITTHFWRLDASLIEIIVLSHFFLSHQFFSVELNSELNSIKIQPKVRGFWSDIFDKMFVLFEPHIDLITIYHFSQLNSSINLWCDFKRCFMRNFCWTQFNPSWITCCPGHQNFLVQNHRYVLSWADRKNARKIPL